MSGLQFIAYDHTLERYPKSRERVQYIQITTPTRAKVPEYGALRQRLGVLAGDIGDRLRDSAGHRSNILIGVSLGSRFLVYFGSAGSGLSRRYETE